MYHCQCFHFINIILFLEQNEVFHLGIGFEGLKFCKGNNRLYFFLSRRAGEQQEWFICQLVRF